MNRWAWRAHFKDGSMISQGDFNPDTGKEWSSDHIPTESLARLTLEPQVAYKPRIVVEVGEGETFKRFWRQYVFDGGGSETCWVIALEKNGVCFYNFFRPDGSWVLSTSPEGSDITI